MLGICSDKIVFKNYYSNRFRPVIGCLQIKQEISTEPKPSFSFHFYKRKQKQSLNLGYEFSVEAYVLRVDFIQPIFLRYLIPTNPPPLNIYQDQQHYDLRGVLRYMLRVALRIVVRRETFYNSQKYVQTSPSAKITS